jgi:hypothetical protein
MAMFRRVEVVTNWAAWREKAADYTGARRNSEQRRSIVARVAQAATAGRGEPAAPIARKRARLPYLGRVVSSAGMD